MIAINHWKNKTLFHCKNGTPFILGFSNEAMARNFYIFIGVIIFIAGVLTDYEGKASQI